MEIVAETVAPPDVLVLAEETVSDIFERDALLDRAMGPDRKKKSSERLRRNRRPAEGLAFIARDGEGRLIGTVRLWNVAFAAEPGIDGRGRDPLHGPRPSTEKQVAALLLGPLAVEPSLKGAGVGSSLMRKAISEAIRRGHRAILLVGDAPYYARFGFSAEKTGALAMPGPYERDRFLALELEAGALDAARGVLKATGRKIPVARMSLAA